MKIALIGGAGFIGQQIIKTMKDDWDIITFDRKVQQLKTLYLDITNPETFTNIFNFIKESDVIINLACHQLDVSDFAPIENAQVNIIGTLRLLNFLRKLGAKAPKLLHFSTGSVYQLHKLANHYSVSKHAGDQYVQLYVKKYNLDATILRPFQVFGVGGHGITNKFLNQALNREPYTIHGDGEQIVNPTHVDDVVDVTYRIIEGEHWKEIFTVGGCQWIHVNQLADLIDEIIGYKNDRKHGQQPSHYKELQFMVEYHHFVELREKLDWTQPFTLKERLEQTWLKLKTG